MMYSISLIIIEPIIIINVFLLNLIFALNIDDIENIRNIRNIWNVDNIDNKELEVKKQEIINNPFVLHLLFDYYSGAIGSSRIEALKNFQKSLQYFTNNVISADLADIFAETELLENDIDAFEQILLE